MQKVSFLLAGLLCLAAVIGQLVGLPRVGALALLAGAAVFLALGFVTVGKRRDPGEVELDEEQRAEITRLLEEGKYGTAIGQVRLWFRNATDDDAEAVVRALARDS